MFYNAGNPHSTPNSLVHSIESLQTPGCDIPPAWLLKYRPPFPNNYWGLVPYDLLLQFDYAGMRSDSRLRWLPAHTAVDTVEAVETRQALIEQALGADIDEVYAIHGPPFFPVHQWEQWELEFTRVSGWQLTEGQTFGSRNDASIPATPVYSVRDPKTGEPAETQATWPSDANRDAFAGMLPNEFEYLGSLSLSPTEWIRDAWRPESITLEPFWP
ncbi:hypothetical protein GYB59_02145 [bacterium]|nr:hypothetical protein [bacterium]